MGLTAIVILKFPLFYNNVKTQQITECPVEEWAERVWLILCLCAVAWQPSRGLARYYCAWLRVRARALMSPASTGSVTSVASVTGGARAAHCAQWCLDNCRGAAPRQLPPSTVEIAVSILIIKIL